MKTYVLQIEVDVVFFFFLLLFFFFKQKTAYEITVWWSSDVCSSDLPPVFSLRRSIPPILRCNPKQRDSLKIGRRVSPNLHKWTGLSPSLAPCSNGLIRGDNTEPTSQNYNSGPNLIDPDSKFGLFPVHSPLLRESLLFSFPPLINMLKLSG